MVSSEGRSARPGRARREDSACRRSRQSSRGARANRSRSTTINVPDPGPGEALVQVQTCGVCHTDLHYREGGINDEFPFLLGHEAAGVVEAVGDDVTRSRPGLRRPQLARGVRRLPGLQPRRAVVLLRTFNATQKMTLRGEGAGTELTPGARHRLVRREDPGRRGPVHQGRRLRAPGRRRPARLRRDGRPRRGDQHRQRGPRQVRGRDRLRRRRGRRRGRAPRSPVRPRSSPSTSTTGSSRSPRSWAPPTP